MAAVQKLHEESQRDQFLMKLRNEFKTVRSNLMSHDPSPSLDTYQNELLRKELTRVTQSTMDSQTTSVVNYAAQGKPQNNYAAQGQPQNYDMSKTQFENEDDTR